MNMIRIEKKAVNTINLFEYSNKEKYSGNADELENLLEKIWKRRKETAFTDTYLPGEDLPDEDRGSGQKFISFLKHDYIKSKNYVGIISINGHVINLLPKFFYDENRTEWNSDEIRAIHANILWWLSYCDKFKFPNFKTGISSLKSGFFEIIIHAYASYTRNVLNNMLYSAYEEVAEELPFVRGRIDTNKYIKENIAKARWNKISCVYDSFEFDNQFNRIIKFVSRLLTGVTHDIETKRLLSEIIFILDEVSDVRVTYADCEKVKLNPLYQNLGTVLDYCRLFLSNSSSYTYKDELKVFAFLLPMEEIFEGFLYGFMDKHLRDAPGVANLEYQKSDLYLAQLFEDGELVRPNLFNLKHDICFDYLDQKIIIDAKYKRLDTKSKGSYANEKKYGVSQSDLYQSVAYAIRRRCNNLFLVYPNSLAGQRKSEGSDPSVTFRIHDEFSHSDIDVGIVKIPIIHQSFPSYETGLSLENNYSQTVAVLKEYLSSSILK